MRASRTCQRPLVVSIRACEGVSPLSDPLEATIQKYDSHLNLPIPSPSLDRLGQKMAARLQHNSAGVTAGIVPPSASSSRTITITAQKAATVRVTGLTVRGGSGNSSDASAGQTISYINLGAGQSVTPPLR